MNSYKFILDSPPTVSYKRRTDHIGERANRVANKLQPGEADEWYDRHKGEHEDRGRKVQIFWSAVPENGWYWQTIPNEDPEKVNGPFWSSKSALEDAINEELGDST